MGSLDADRQSARAEIRRRVKRILRKYGYPRDLQDAAVQNVLQQAEALSAERKAATYHLKNVNNLCTNSAERHRRAYVTHLLAGLVPWLRFAVTDGNAQPPLGHLHGDCAQKITFADVHAAMAQDRVGGCEMEIEVRQHKVV